jgi:hypothetical protein
MLILRSYDSRDYMFGEHRTSTPFQRMKEYARPFVPQHLLPGGLAAAN